MSTTAVLQQVQTGETQEVETMTSTSPSRVNLTLSEALSEPSLQNVEWVNDDAVPQDGQRVFDVAPSNIINKRRRIAVTILIVVANLMQMVSNSVGVIGGLEISRILGVQGVHATWVAASYPLTQGTFVLMSGRLGAVYGHKNMLLAGGLWFCVCTLIAGFIPNFVAFNALRALSGIGGAFILPNGAAMIGITNPPGRARNLSYAFFGASAPIGGYVGGIMIGLFLQYSSFKWCLVFQSLSTAAVFLPLWALLPREIPVDRHGKIDWPGAVLGTSALIIFNFVWNQAPAVGWSTPYEIGLFLTSVTLFAIFGFWEYRSPHPIMPLSVFKAPSFAPLLLVVLLNYMAIGTLLWYMLIWLQNERHWSVLQVAVGWTPFLPFATFAAILAAWLVPRLAAQWIVAIGTVTVGVASVLIATMPVKQTYWRQVFPATILMSFCPDLVYTAAQIIASNAVRRNQQGVAGSLIGTLNLYGNSLGLGFAATVETEIAKKQRNTVLGYRSALIFGIGIAVVALLVDVLFVRLVKDEREGWDHADDADAGVGGDESVRAETTGTELRNLSSR